MEEQLRKCRMWEEGKVAIEHMESEWHDMKEKEADRENLRETTECLILQEFRKRK